ncbi:prepilin-type N-terminal cleavage/methylation domain-containing protein [Desulfopila aestuarii]|uniref:Type IV pilus assembly protein PilW n=1 Tax=Desulfopila aestuarii DSM 18488 TaxID=1121416 RepID=A0A1M7Y1Z1_9BACT|nr:prepilin-type N-terminal cleavage/methylation domain-containing protein [Desulfopila aestuarii]SHO45723.1 type IV pilus assembly protein PilW [Desulfopila aestuarii DSM 18488]
MNNKGFTLIELLISVVILGVISSLTYPAFVKLLNGSKVETSSSEAMLDKMNTLELIRLDLEHANYGIATDDATPPLTWTAATKTLAINSTINNTNQASIGWLLYNCGSAIASLSTSLVLDSREDSTNTCVSLLDIDRKFAILTRTTQTCPDKGVYTAFPVSNSSDPTCSAERYTTVSYTLSTGNTLSTCAQGTRNLLRAVGGAAGEPVLNCVADYDVRFELDINGDGTVDSVQSTPPGTTPQILSQVKNIELYVLMQASKKDPNLTSNENLFIDASLTLSKASVTEDPSKYRWKVVRISGKPMSR